MRQARLYRKAEKELLAAASRVFQKRPMASNLDVCPSAADLRQFANGKEASADRREYYLTHLADCDRCMDFMSYLRTRRLLVNAALAAAIALAAVVTFWTVQHRAMPKATGLAVLDLRSVSPTRGDEIGKDTTLKVRRKFDRLQLILPVGSAEGTYELALYSGNGETQPVSGHLVPATWVNQNLVINVPLDSKAFQPGHYRLALRHGKSDWEYYLLKLE